MFIHDWRTFGEIWEKLGEDRGTGWEPQKELEQMREWGLKREDWEYMDQPVRGIRFAIRR